MANPLIDLLSSSPIRPVQEHMTKVKETAEELFSFVQAAQAGQWDQAREIQKSISRKEREADKLKTSVRKHLPKSLFMPVRRTDLLELVRMQDNIANCSKDIAGLMFGRSMTFPETLEDTLFEFLEASISTCDLALEVISELDQLIGVGFSSKGVKEVDTKIKALGKMERQSDKRQVQLRNKLLKLEDQLPPVDVVFMYKVIDLIGDLADDAERVGSRLQILISL